MSEKKTDPKIWTKTYRRYAGIPIYYVLAWRKFFGGSEKLEKFLEEIMDRRGLDAKRAKVNLNDKMYLHMSSRLSMGYHFVKDVSRRNRPYACLLLLIGYQPIDIKEWDDLSMEAILDRVINRGIPGYLVRPAIENNLDSEMIEILKQSDDGTKATTAHMSLTFNRPKP